MERKKGGCASGCILGRVSLSVVSSRKVPWKGTRNDPAGACSMMSDDVFGHRAGWTGVVLLWHLGCVGVVMFPVPSLHGDMREV